jgi:transcriptional regulator with XRE-family HTH domain
MRLTQKELADRLGVTPAAVSQATTESHKCQGYPVAKWATRRCGQVLWYEVPSEADIYETETGAEDQPSPSGGERIAEETMEALSRFESHDSD